MSDALYEQYKDALRRGHVAALHGKLDEALGAYEEAAGVAPDRPLPHASRGAVLARLGRHGDALSAFDAALARAPRDEAALIGRAEALAQLGRRVEAASTFDRLAASLEHASRLVEALDAARRALEFAESRGRRDLVRELSGRLAASPLDEATRVTLDRALSVLDAAPMGRRDARPARSAASLEPDAAGPVVAPDPAGAGEAEAGPAAPPEAAASSEADREPDTSPEPAPEPEAAPADAPDGDAVAAEADAPDGDAVAATADEPPALTDAEVAALTDLAERAAEAHDAEAAKARFLELAGHHRRAGRPNTALDACYLVLGVAPDAVDLHLELVGLYDELGWAILASEKLALLERLVELDDDAHGRAAVAALTARRTPSRAPDERSVEVETGS